MSERSTQVLQTSPVDVASVRRHVSSLGPHDWRPDLLFGGRDGAPSRKPLSPRQGPGTPGGSVSSDDDLLESTLAFSGSYVSDDGNVAIRRSDAASFEYSGDRFVGQCTVCSRARLIAVSGEALPDITAAIGFAATHRHGDVD